MGIGESMRNAVTSAINSLGSNVSITSYTQTTSDGGYEGQSETTTAINEELAIPFEEFQNILKQKFGDLKTAGLQLALKSTATFEISGTTKYKITFNGNVHDITNVRRYSIQDVLVAWIITLSERYE